jgi:hypothetical protein
VEFAFRLTGTGWGEARVADSAAHALLLASDITDVLGELLLAVGTLQEGAEGAMCSWILEPGEYRWLFARTDDRVSLKILWFDDSHPRRRDDEGLVMFAIETSLREMARAFTTGMRAVLEEWGEDGFLAKWHGSPFPTGLLELVEARAKHA